MKAVLLLGLICSTSVFSSVKKGQKDDIARYRSEVMDLGARLSTLEREIGSKNNLYISSLGQISQLESDITLYHGKLKEIQGQVKEAQGENKKILQSYLAESDNDASEAWQKSVHFELLKQAQSKLRAREEELRAFETRISNFSDKLASLRSTEEELGQMIRELEARKKTTMEEYLSKVQSKKKAERVAGSAELKKRLNVVKKEFSEVPVVMTKPDRYFARPVDDYLTFSSGPKGVTFKYRAIQPVKAVAGGKIVFAGDLASYGQVVLIDHGNDLRSVLLGRMNIKVKKNDSVNDGDVLAYTQNDGSEDQNLYFEVRKKNTAQNTILWLEPSGVSKI